MFWWFGCHKAVKTIWIITLVAALTSVGLVAQPDPKQLVEEAVATMGGKDAFYAKQGATYTYTYRKPGNTADISTETYDFPTEMSHAEYSRRENLFPELNGTMVQGYTGQKTWVTVDGEPVTDPEVVKRADFMRKTNFYWFAMMFKLLDPGIFYEYQGTQTVNGIDYHKVLITFGQNVGDVQDKYLLHIHPETKLIDQFLFTIMDFGMAEPFLMTVEYEDVDGILLPAIRKYVKALDWNGEPANDQWVDEIMTDIRFLDPDPALFQN